jgi:hypothetical protein
MNHHAGDAIVVNPEISSGVPIAGIYRYPQPASRPERYTSPATKGMSCVRGSPRTGLMRIQLLTLRRTLTGNATSDGHTLNFPWSLSQSCPNCLSTIREPKRAFRDICGSYHADSTRPLAFQHLRKVKKAKNPPHQ